MNKYKRILLKLSGEALAKDGNTVDPNPCGRQSHDSCLLVQGQHL
jgi:uridylate kinase